MGGVRREGLDAPVRFDKYSKHTKVCAGRVLGKLYPARLYLGEEQQASHAL
jgi:hypothetical protein